MKTLLCSGGYVKWVNVTDSDEDNLLLHNIGIKHHEAKILVALKRSV